MAGKMAFYSKLFKKDVWIIDIGASDHMTSNTHSFSSIKPFHKPFPVNLLNDSSVDVLATGNVILSDYLKLLDVLFIPSFKVNLLSISRITKTLNCSVTFFPDFFFF